MPYISIIIPVSTEELHLDRCLEKIKLQDFKNYEVTLIIDGSTTKGYLNSVSNPEYNIIKLDKKRGPGYARNAGAKNAKGDILFFVDSDILLPRNALSLILDSYRKYPDIAGAVGLYSENNSRTNFVSIFKNLQVRFEESDKPDFISNFRSSVFSITKRNFELVGGFDEELGAMPCEDYEFSLKLERYGLRFHLNRDLQVIHEKRITLFQLLREDFERVRSYLIIALNNKKSGSVNYFIKLHRSYLKSFIEVTTPWLFLFSTLMSLLKLWFLLLSFILFFSFLLSQLPFLQYLKKVKSFSFMVKGLLLRFIEMLVAGYAIVSGILKHMVFKNALH